MRKKITFLGNDTNSLFILFLIIGGSLSTFYMINKGAETLPNKDAATYKQLAVQWSPIQKLYDAKNYKKGLKNA